ncbi:MAG: flagellar hook-associated protein FlgK [Lachnospiraceae bacterium]|nr:flagellar hook-associated protein FlgK [Lachnospiraceae bacterium]
MGSSFFGLDIAISGLYTSQASLNTTAHNIANADREGFCKQYVTTKAGTPLRSYSTYGMVGTGVEAVDILQNRNQYYDIKYWDSNGLNGKYEAKSEYLNNMETYFNEIKGDGFTETFDELFNTISALETDPSNLERRTQLLKVSETFGVYFNYLSDNLKSIQTDINFQLKNHVDRINTLAEEIATITKKINTLETSGLAANDLRDSRALMIDELSGIASVSVEEYNINIDENSFGQVAYVVKIDGQTLVDTYSYNQLVCEPKKELENQNDADGLYHIRWSTDSYGGQSFNMYSDTLGGKLQGLIEIRDGNNYENLYGKTTVKKGDTQVKVTSASINEIAKLNAPETGYITVGSDSYRYTGFTVDIIYDEEKGTTTCEYTFDLEEEIVRDGDYNASVGRSIDFKGVPYYQTQLNEFLRTFANEFNTLHNQGQDVNGEAGLDFFTYKDDVSGAINELTEKKNLTQITTSGSSYYNLTAGNFAVSDKIANDPDKIAAADDISLGVSNSKILEKLYDLKSDVKMFKQGMPSSFLQALIAELAVDVNAEDGFHNNQKNITLTIDNQRMSISGVDLDEEAMDLVKYQNAYNYSAKVISVMNEVFDKLINDMGVI